MSIWCLFSSKRKRLEVYIKFLFSKIKYITKYYIWIILKKNISLIPWLNVFGVWKPFLNNETNIIPWIVNFLEDYEYQRCIINVSTKEDGELLSTKVRDAGIHTKLIHKDSMEDTFHMRDWIPIVIIVGAILLKDPTDKIDLQISWNMPKNIQDFVGFLTARKDIQHIESLQTRVFITTNIREEERVRDFTLWSSLPIVQLKNRHTHGDLGSNAEIDVEILEEILEIDTVVRAQAHTRYILPGKELEDKQKILNEYRRLTEL